VARRLLVSTAESALTQGAAMKARLLLTALTAFGLGFGTLVGCDETVKDEKKVEVKDDGTVKKTEEKVVREADGTVKKTEEKKVDVPNK
jgi:hypothetical protein